MGRALGHAARNSPEYRVWSGMLTRCYNMNAPNYHKYGARGVSVCDRWRNAFVAFLEDMGPRPLGTTLDRINGAGGYEKANCRWATAREQNENRRSAHRVMIDGEIQCLTEWARRAGVSDTAMLYRLRRGLTGADLLRPSHRGKRLLP